MNRGNPSYERYERQILLPQLGTAGQDRLRRARVLVVGAGGLGCPVLQYLAAAGVGTINIVDSDVVSLHNLHRQVLYTMQDIGLPKAERAAVALQQLNPDITIMGYKERLTAQHALDIIEHVDIVVDGTDNFASRYMINDACVLLGKPLVYAAVSRFEGQVAIFNYQMENGIRSANYRHLFPQPPGDGEIMNCAEAGVLGVLPGIMGMLQANETIKLITGIGQPLINRLLTYNALNNQTYEVELTAGEAAQPAIPATVEEFIATDYEWLCAAGAASLEINSAQFDEMITTGGITIIDVREPGEQPAVTEFAHLRLPLSRIHEPIAGTGTTIILFCQSGKRSLQAAHYLTRNMPGAGKIYSLQGGILQWKKTHKANAL